MKNKIAEIKKKNTEWMGSLAEWGEQRKLSLSWKQSNRYYAVVQIEYRYKKKNGASGTCMTIKGSKVCFIRVWERGTEGRNKEEL